MVDWDWCSGWYMLWLGVVVIVVVVPPELMAIWLPGRVAPMNGYTRASLGDEECGCCCCEGYWCGCGVGGIFFQSRKAAHR